MGLEAGLKKDGCVCQGDTTADIGTARVGFYSFTPGLASRLD